jgi:hypothetical protein
MVILPSELPTALELTYARDCGRIITTRPPRAYPPDPPPKPVSYSEQAQADHEQFCVAQNIFRVGCQICRDGFIQREVRRHFDSYRPVLRETPLKKNRVQPSLEDLRERCQRMHRNPQRAPMTCNWCHGRGYEEGCFDHGREPEPEGATALVAVKRNCYLSQGGEKTYTGMFLPEERPWAKHHAARLLNWKSTKYFSAPKSSLSDDQKRAVEAEVLKVLRLRGSTKEGGVR